jgi:hypothetical protein
MATYQTKINSLYEDLELAVKEHDKAVNQVVAAKELIISIQGGISVLHELQEDEAVDAAHAIVNAL